MDAVAQEDPLLGHFGPSPTPSVGPGQLTPINCALPLLFYKTAKRNKEIVLGLFVLFFLSKPSAVVALSCQLADLRGLVKSLGLSVLIQSRDVTGRVHRKTSGCRSLLSQTCDLIG